MCEVTLDLIALAESNVASSRCGRDTGAMARGPRKRQICYSKDRELMAKAFAKAVFQVDRKAFDTGAVGAMASNP
jgi:hypothetical protein